MSYALNFKINYFLFFPPIQSCTERLIIFLPTGLTVSPDKEATENTLSNKVGEEDFSTASVSSPWQDG